MSKGTISDVAAHIFLSVCSFRYIQKKLGTILRGTATHSGEVTPSKLFYLPSEKESTVKGKNLIPVGANSFLLQ